MIHNIIDGLAIGIVCSTRDIKLISSTAVAIIAHEIPHEVGDTGVLINSRFSPM